MSQPMRPDDPAYWMLEDPTIFSTPVPGVTDPHCYICNDPEFAQMGLPLCRECPNCIRIGWCRGHIPADDCVCTVCGHDEREDELVYCDVILHYRNSTRLLPEVPH